MAPTEVLAEQHHSAVRVMLDGVVVGDGDNLFGERPIRVELLTNRTTATERKAILAGLRAGEVDIVIGTHALIQGDIGFASLGVAVIDEQHRFGVEQRAALRDKGDTGATPDVLVMTATPIPRTAAMTVYGDLDVSVLDEMPPGRTPVSTTKVTAEEEDQVWEAVRAEVAAGRQAYVVCPLIEESEKLEATSAQETFERLTGADGALAGLRVELLHGRVPAAEKEAVMDRFRSGDVDVLVATTVIEVGVDVPNATVMVVLDADRFGIAQLHQLRGRVGRGDAAVLLLPRERGVDPRGRGPSRRDGPHHRRVRAGRGRPRPPGRGHDPGRAAEGPQRPQARLAPQGPRLGDPGPGGRVRAGRRRSRPRRATRCCATSSSCSWTPRTRSSCSRADWQESSGSGPCCQRAGGGRCRAWAARSRSSPSTTSSSSTWPARPTCSGRRPLLGADPAYEVRTVAPNRSVTSDSGMRLTADAVLGADDDPIDTLVVVGGLGVAAGRA